MLVSWNNGVYEFCIKKNEYNGNIEIYGKPSWFAN